MEYLLLYLAIASVLTAAEASYCKLVTQPSFCEHTITCTNRTSSVTIPGCRGSNTVKFIITGSTIPMLTASFFGATNFDSKVRSIIAVNNNWTTIELRTFSYYKEATLIDLSKNNVKLIKSLAFKDMSKLVTMNLSSNIIEELDPKTLYLSDTLSLNVVVLDLSYNRLSHLSMEMSGLANLKKLFLQGNVLHNLESSCFSSLKSLQILNLEHNSLSTLNNTMRYLKSLIELYVNNNYLRVFSSNDTSEKSSLQIVNASHNVIGAMESNMFRSALNLTIIDFSFNNISTPIEDQMFVSNLKLKYVDFYNNHIEVLGVNIFANNSDINYVNFERNNLNIALEAEMFVGMRNIVTLQITDQSISSIKERAFEEMHNLQYLNLTRNKISNIANSSFVNAPISKLDISHNQISTLGFLKELCNLTELYLNHNNISVLSRLTFFAQTKLKILDLSMNMILTFEELSLPLVELQYLYITGNRLTGVIQKNIFSPAKMLRFLDISNFNISRIEAMAFANLPNLARLNLSHNNIDYIDSNNFVGLNNMFSLDISNNRLKQLAFNGNVLSNLKAVYLNNNELTNISSIFSESCKIMYLDLSNNGIRDLSGVDAKIFPNITVLRLSHNNITNFNNPYTNTLTSLIDLNLSSNNLTDITLKYFKELMTLDLSDNSLTCINSTFFENVDYIQALDLSRNNISVLPPGTFQNMRNLKLLNLSSNHLSRLRYGSLKGLHKTELLDISRNNLHSIEVDVFHECVKLNTLILDYNFLTTLDVVSLTYNYLFNLKTLSIGGNPISCREVVLHSKSVRANQVEVTAVDKVYHEDNVHGIKCGNDTSATDETTTEPSTMSTSDLTTTIILLATFIMVILLIATVVFIYLKVFRGKGFVIMNERSVAGSLEMDSTDLSDRSLI